MELQSGAIVIIIILLSFVLISYAIYLIYNENKQLKVKLNEVYNNMTNLETNITNLFTQHTERETEEAESELESDNESEEQFETFTSTTTNKPSFEMFGNSSEELEYLKQIQNTIQQGNKIQELEEIADNDESEVEESEVLEAPEEIEQPEIKINIPSKSKKCSKILTHGKRKDQECNRPVTDNNDVCKLHLTN
jgi:hypothetical protein